MNYIKQFNEVSKDDVRLVGGKGASLGEMTQAGISVPDGFVVVAPAFDSFLDETHIREEIEARFREIKLNDIYSIDRASNVIRGVIHDTEIPKHIVVEIIEVFNEFDEEFVAVRSSATAEDSGIASWAGELETFLNVTRDEFLEKIKQCWSSLFTPRAIFYRFEKGLNKTPISVAVVVQKMIQSEVSGVAFTVHPVTEDRNQMIIEAGLGLGEAIVSGQITPDSYVVNKTDMMILDISVSHQERKLIRKNHADKNEGQNEWVETLEARSKQKLSGKNIIGLAEICKKIETHYGFPCDIEWAFSGGEFYIIQSRPITTLRKNLV